jgi:hypothetical protein
MMRMGLPTTVLPPIRAWRQPACKTVPSNNNATGSISLQIAGLHRERMIK